MSLCGRAHRGTRWQRHSPLGGGLGRAGCGWTLGASAVVLEAAVDGLDVGEDALPVGLPHGHHVVHVEQRVNAGLLTATRNVAR